jgi:hypothetical protein
MANELGSKIWMDAFLNWKNLIKEEPDDEIRASLSSLADKREKKKEESH